MKITTPDWIYDNYLKYVFYIESKIYKEKLKIKPEIDDFVFFKNNIFYLSDSFSYETKKMLLKIILKGKGMCSKELTNEVTIFITKEEYLDKNDKKLLLQSSLGTCKFINYSWLLKCYIDKCHILESVYEIPNAFHSSSSVRGSLFKGLTFFIYNFDTKKERRLKEIILLQQGTLYDDQTSSSEVKGELLIVTSFGRDFDPSYINTFTVKKKLITNYWVEKCIMKNKLYDFDQCPMFTPCTLKNTITGFQFLILTTSGYGKFDKIYIKQLILKMGSKFSNNLLSDTTIVICNDEKKDSEKYTEACNRNVPVVSVQWLYDCYNKKSFISYDKYKIKKDI